MNQNVQEDGVCSDEIVNNDVNKEQVDSTQSAPYSDDDLINRLMHNEDKFNALNYRINDIQSIVEKLSQGLGTVVEHVNNVTKQFNETSMVMRQVMEKLNQQVPTQNQQQPAQENVLQQQVSNGPSSRLPGPDLPNYGQNPNNTQSAEQIMSEMQSQQQQLQQTERQQEPTGIKNIGAILGKSGLLENLSNLAQMYIASKLQQPAVDPAQAFYSNLESSINLIKGMSGLISGLKNDWIREEKLVHQIEKGGGNKVIRKKEDDL